jgi:hypothetical protein
MKRSGRHIGRIFSPPSSSPRPGQVVHHQPAEAADRAFLDGDQHLVLARQALDQRGVERLGEARIGDGAGEPVRGQLIRRLQAFGSRAP